MAKQRHGRHHTHECLAIKGEDRHEEDGVGMKMKRVQIVVAEDGIEEVGERGTSPTTALFMKKG